MFECIGVYRGLLREGTIVDAAAPTLKPGIRMGSTKKGTTGILVSKRMWVQGRVTPSW